MHHLRNAFNNRACRSSMQYIVHAHPTHVATRFVMSIKMASTAASVSDTDIATKLPGGDCEKYKVDTIITPHTCARGKAIGFVCHLSSVVCRLSARKLPDLEIWASK